MLIVHPDDTDDLPHGETAFYLPHQNFCPSRDDCPNECFVWTEHESDDDESEVEETEKKSRAMKKRKLNPRPRRPDPGFWFEDNKILLDPHNNPVRKHPDMPLTLSSMTEGYKLDLMRILNAGISQRDEWARMPRWIRRQVPKTDTFVIKYIGSPNTHVNMPSLRFREEKGAAAGNNREGTKKIRKGLKALFAEHGFDPSLTGSTRGFGRDLFSWEQAMVKFGNKGKYPGRAGETRALNKETREENLEKTKKKIERGRKKAEAEASKTDAASAKRPREDQDGSYRNSNPAPQKSKSGGRPRTSGREQTPLQPQRYGTYGSGQMPIPNPNTLEAGHRSYYGAHGAAPSPYQNTNAFGGNQHVPSLGNSQYIRSRNVPSYSGIGHELEASLNEPELESRGQTWSAQGPITQNHYPRAQYQQQHDFSSGHMNNNQYGPPVQHQGLSRGQNGAPKYRGGTLGPGGRKIYQAPKQVLGRRGREDSGEVNDVVYRNNQEAAQAGTPVPNAREVETSRTTGPQQVGQPHASEYQAGELEYSVRASQFSDDDAPSKRRRNNQNPGTESRPERRLHHGKAPRPQYYGATGAPIPLMPPESVFETVPYFNGNAGVQDFGNYHQNGWVANTGLGGQASYEYKPYSNDGSHGLVAVSNENGDRGMRHMQAQHKREFGPILFPPGQASYDPYAPQPHLPQNTDGAPNGDFDSYGGRLRGYAPPQALGKRDRPDLDSESFEGSLSPAEKRRRMPSTQGYHLPPGTQRRAEKKLRKSKRDENLPPFVFNVDVGGPNAQHGSHAAATSDVNEAVPIAYQAPQVPNAQGPVPPLVSTPAPTGQIPITDIRNTPPATEYECMRLQEALECTRWAYEQWTGMAAPETNIFDSYNAQFGVIFQSFHIWWASGSNPERSQSVEWLVQLDPWEGSVADWKPLAPDFFFYECVRRGFYAPRNLDGSLQQS